MRKWVFSGFLLTLLLFLTGSALAAALEDQKERSDEPLYAAHIDFSKINKDKAITSAVFVVAPSLDAVLTFHLAKRLLLRWAPNIKHWVVILDGFWSTSPEKPYDDLLVFADIYERLGATKVLRGMPSPHDQTSFAKAVEQAYTEAARRMKPLESPTNYLAGSHNKSIYFEAGPSLSMAAFLINGPNEIAPNQRFAHTINMVEQSYLETTRLAFPKSQQFLQEFLGHRWTYGKNSILNRLRPWHNIRDDGYLSSFFAELDRITLAPTDKTLLDFVETDAEGVKNITALSLNSLMDFFITKVAKQSVFSYSHGPCPITPQEDGRLAYDWSKMVEPTYPAVSPHARQQLLVDIFTDKVFKKSIRDPFFKFRPKKKAPLILVDELFQY